MVFYLDIGLNKDIKCLKIKKTNTTRMFKKVFTNWNEALNYTYVDYGRSVYYSFQGENLPRVKGGILMKEWCSGCPVERIRGVHFEVTPLWVTITIVEEDGSAPLTKNFERKNRSVNAVLHEVFG